MLPGPVFQYELLALARRKRYYVLRFLYGFLLLYLIAQNAPELRYNARSFNGEMTIQELSSLGLALFATFAFTQSIVILIMTPTLVAGVIADEKQRKTLLYMMASCLSSGEIVLGKLAARLLHIAVFLAVGWPIVAILSFVGGIDPNQVMLFFVASASSAFFIASFSMLISVHAKRPREAISTSYLIEVAWLFVPILISGLMPLGGTTSKWIYELIRPVNDWLIVSSPFAFLTQARGFFGSPAQIVETAYWMIGTQVLCGSILVSIAIARLRPVFKQQGEGRSRISTVFAKKGRRLLPRPTCGEDAMIWKEFYVSRTNPVAKIAGMLIFLGIVGLIGYSTFEVAKPAMIELWNEGYSNLGARSARTELNGYLRFILTTLFICWSLGTASYASSSMSSEREEDTWISLIATPLSPLEIVRAKILGAFWATRWIGFVWMVLLLFGLIVGSIHPLGFFASLSVTTIYIWFSCVLGVFFSLRSRSSGRALTATIGTLIATNGLYLLLFLPFSIESSFRFLGVMPFVEVLAIMSYEDVSWLLAGSHSGYGNGYDGLTRGTDLFVTSLASFSAYAIAAFMLTLYLITDFDVMLDRPRTERAKQPSNPSILADLKKPTVDATEV